MANYPSFKEAASKGFVFPEARAWIGQPGMAQDAALITTANTTVPVELTAYIDPRVVEILTAVRNARALFSEVQKGDWTTTYDKWAVEELTGASQPYTDYANGTTSGVNYDWMSREQYVYQTTITYGDKELDVSARAKIDLASRKQTAAARTLDIDSNKFALLGVAGKAIYGVLNDPNLPSSTAVSTAWASVNAEGIYNDINTKLFSPLTTASGGHITYDTPLKLAVSPAMNSFMGKTNSYGKTVGEMLKAQFANLEIVIIPELASMAAGDTIFLIAPELDGSPSAELPFGVKMRAGRLVPGLSHYSQKFVASTYGGIVYRPFCFASITGMDAA
jgi:hypothetical protein